MKRLLALLCSLSLFITSARPATLYYFSPDGYLFGVAAPGVSDPVSALNALTTPPVQVPDQPPLTSALPAQTSVTGLSSDHDTTIVEFSPEIVGSGFDDARLEAIFDQVRATLAQFSLPASIRLETGGRLLSEFLVPTPVIPPGPKVAQAGSLLAEGGALSGKSISLSPGHGKVWTGAAYSFERPVYCDPLTREDDHNLEIMKYLNQYLTQDGALTKVYRCLDQSFGTHAPSGEPWWRISAGYWLRQLGYPCSVYASSTGDCTLGAGSSESADSLRSRGLASDYDATDIYVSLHSNGLKGDCSGTGCPNGTCTYYDTSTEHAPWGAISQTLATKVNAAIVNAIRTRYTDATWTDRGSLNANGSQAETRIPNRAAILIELAFHDSCSRDAVYLRDNFFRSTSMWATYKGICDYFGVIPTWDYYSYEIVSDDIPPVMPPGSTSIVHITVRNRGVLWNDARQFRLGAVGDSDPFTTTTRHNVGAEIGPGSTRTFTITLRAPTTLGTYNTDWRMLREGVTWFGPTLARTILVSTNGDQVAPATPTGLAATAATSSQVNLKWNPASDNVGVTGYRVYRNAVLLGTSSTTNYSDNNLASKTTYTYQVSALDGSGNVSSLSAPVQVTTLPQLDLILDNSQGTAVGAWTIGTSSTDKYLADYHWLTTSTSASGTFTWTPSIEQPGFYSVFIWYPQGPNRCTNSLFTIQYAGGAAGVRINQTSGGGQWVSLGVNRPFVAGTTGKVQLNNLSVEPAKVVMADAVRFTYASPLPALASPHIITVAGTARLTWTNPYCVLQENASLDPMSWTDIPGAKSPYQISTTTGPRKFYRLRY